MKQVCVVTRGTGGIGAASVRELPKTYQVLFCDVNQEKVDQFAARLKEEGLDAQGMLRDVSDRARCDALAQRAASMGELAGVIHLTGLTPTYAKHPDITSELKGRK